MEYDHEYYYFRYFFLLLAVTVGIEIMPRVRNQAWYDYNVCEGTSVFMLQIFHGHPPHPNMSTISSYPKRSKHIKRVEQVQEPLGYKSSKCIPLHMCVVLLRYSFGMIFLLGSRGCKGSIIRFNTCSNVVCSLNLLPRSYFFSLLYTCRYTQYMI